MSSAHTFHIPVMGLGYTIDTPLNVSQYGIDSVISIVDDVLIEKFRKFHCEKNKIEYNEIKKEDDDYRAERITSYLNLVNDLANKKYEALKKSVNEAIDDSGNWLREYVDMLPESSDLVKDFRKFREKYFNVDDLQNWINENINIGSIDVNIMTKLDKDNYKKDEKLPVEYNDAHAALRGYANSNLASGIVLSAGMNPRLYSYLAKFRDFFPDANGNIKKKIILKVSDYRSAFIQGKFLAKKGLWVSEYRIESGLNCGGHAFATDGFLLGPVLEEFRQKRDELTSLIWKMLKDALTKLQKHIPENPLPLKVTAQGGIGTADEHNFLLNYYGLDSVGWGTPFMLVPEVTRVDKGTRQQLADAKEKDLYLSPISPVGVPFNSMRGNTMDDRKQELIDKGRPGSSCPRKFVELNKEFTDKSICTASRQYQHLKIKELQELQLTEDEYQERFDEVVAKACVCTGLGASALMEQELDIKVEGEYVSVCPGPNLAYFDHEVSMKEMIDHIYGRANVISRTDRPHVFIKEISLYINYLQEQIIKTKGKPAASDIKYFTKYIENLYLGIEYYTELYSGREEFSENSEGLLEELQNAAARIDDLDYEIKSISVAA